MMIDVLKIGNDIALPELYQQCITSLHDFSRMHVFDYPPQLQHVHASDADWVASIAEIFKLNESHLFDRIDHCVNFYAIYTFDPAGKWHLRYLAHAQADHIKLHMAHRLAPTTGRKSVVFEKLKKSVRNGCKIGLRLIKIEPDTLRYFVQEKMLTELRKNGALDWNRVGG